MSGNYTVLTLVGARPQFIKAAPVSRALKAAGHLEILVHSGQHYDHGMSQVFFKELGIPTPDVNLGVGSGTQGQQTGRILERFEKVLLEYRPDIVIVHGDTNSTLAGALAAVKLQIPVAHNEAGLRSFNRVMPEEHNRVLTDHCADLLFCPTQTAVNQLKAEGITRGVHRIGDVMYDAYLYNTEVAEKHSTILKDNNLLDSGYLLVTLHRPYNVDYKDRLSGILDALGNSGETVVFPVHPRTRKQIAEFGLKPASNIRLLDPVSYLDMVKLERYCRMILTDSGGVQKEAYICDIPCVTLRPETEWIETVEAGWNRTVGADPDAIIEAVSEKWWSDERKSIFGDGHAAEGMVVVIGDYLSD